jgi:NDP-sugar pyrophosphorylase family protein
MRAMLFTAGLGTRLKPFTDYHPKALAMVNGKTLLQRNLEYLQSFGITEVIVNIHHFGDQIVRLLEVNKGFGSQVHISDETHEVLETGGGLLKARPLLGSEDFVVMNVDILTDLDLGKMIAFHELHQPLVTLAVSERDSSRKLLFDHDMKLCGWKNFVTGEEIVTQSQIYKLAAFSGIHIVNPKIFCMMLEVGKFSIMQTYMRLMHTEMLLGYDHSGGVLIDVGKPESVLEAEKYYA